MCTRCTKSALLYRYRNVVINMTKRLIIAFTAALALMCSACQNNTGMTPEGSSGQTGPALVVSGSTNPSSQNHITTAGISPTTETKGSDTASGPSSAGSVTPDDSHDPTNVVPPTSSATVGPSGSTIPHTSGSKSKPTPGTTATSTTERPETSQTTTRTSTTASTTTTTAATKSPWTYPYDIPAILQECKAEISRVGLVWDDDLTKERSSWDHPHSTGVYTEYPSMFSLKAYIMDEMIPFYIKNQDRYSIKRCKIWFEPDPQYPGDYNIYFLFRPDSA